MAKEIHKFTNIYGHNLKFRIEKIDSVILFISLENDLPFRHFGASIILILGLSFMHYLFLLLLIMILLYKAVFSIKKETLLISKDFGYQLTKKYCLRETVQFIPYEQVQRVFINEVIFRQKIIYILTLLVTKQRENPSKLIPLFEDTLPRLDCLETIYKHIKRLENT